MGILFNESKWYAWIFQTPKVLGRCAASSLPVTFKIYFVSLSEVEGRVCLICSDFDSAQSDKHIMPGLFLSPKLQLGTPLAHETLFRNDNY